MNSIMNKNLKHIIMATEYVEMKKKGLEYIRGISSTAEQISEIDFDSNRGKFSGDNPW